MKRYLFFAIGIAMTLGLAVSTQELNAQVYSDFNSPKLAGGKQFYDIMASAQRVEIAAPEFGLPPSWAQDLDDGYARIPIGFSFEFNNKVYSQILVNVNGFITFESLPPLVRADFPDALFIQSSSYPKNVIAPFWGDHYYRSAIDNIGKVIGTDNLFTESHIAYLNQTVDRFGDGVMVNKIIIQWKDLNINYTDPVTFLPVTSSIATFQVILWENTSIQTDAGDIEFAYGPAGADLAISREQKILTQNSTIGIKGESMDYINGLEFDKTNLVIRTSTKKSGAWQPSHGTDTTIFFEAQGKVGTEWWGDGDVDLSKYKGNKHFGMEQNRFVTVNDAWKLMRSIATRIPLDSVRGRAAFHGDANHTGRYFYDYNIMTENPVGSGQFYPLKKILPWQDENYWENLDHPDWSVSDLNQLFFEVNELDAGIILDYMAAKVPSLPWLDSIPLYGKMIAKDDAATGINFGEAVKISENVYQAPVYLNGELNGPLGVKFDLNADVIKVQANQLENQTVMADAGKDRVVIIGTGEFDNLQPVCFVTFESYSNDVKVSGIRFNDNNIASQGIMLNEETLAVSEFTVENVPNPFTDKTMINVNIIESGVYTLTIYDALGNKIIVLSSDNMNNGLNSFEWNGKDTFGNSVESGMYVCRLTGENTSVSKKIVLNK